MRLAFGDGGDEPVVVEEAGLVVAHMISAAEVSQLLNQVFFITSGLPREAQAAPTPSVEEVVEKVESSPSIDETAEDHDAYDPYEATLNESGFDAAAKDALRFWKIDGEALTVLSLLHNSGEKGRWEAHELLRRS